MNKIREDITEMGGKRLIILEEKPSTEHYLSIVLAKWGTEYVTWIRNTSFEVFSCGHYYSNIADAVADYQNRE